jgi:hypothetical protein
MSEKTSTKYAIKEHLTRIALIRDGNLLAELSNLAPKDCEPVIITTGVKYFEIFEL